jgi:serine/threonine protein kinase
MDPELWKQVDALLEEALVLPPDQREAFVVESSKDNSQLREEVLSLLKAQPMVSSFMERSAMRVAAAALAEDSNLTTSFSYVGKSLGTYDVEKLLGVGGMGEVYLARDTKLDRKIALKILPWQFLADDERLNRFEREARALSSLNHPNLVTIYEVGEAQGQRFIAMELVEGHTLSSLRHKISLKELLSVVAQVAEALWAAHQSGIVHRDVKPDNIMVRDDGYAKVLDFGLVKLTEASSNNSRTNGPSTELGVAMGTLAYMSPEQTAGEAIDHRTDIWSLGVVLYELATGKRPFAGETRQSTINAILSGDPRLPSAIDEHLPKELDHILEKALEKDRDLRYQTASDFRSDIRRLIRQIDSAATSSNAGVVTRSYSGLASRSWVWPIATLGALACLVGPDWSKASRVQLTSQAGTEFFPTLAPDGQEFVYSSLVNGTYDLFKQRVGGKNLIPLTPNSPSEDSEPVFSPSGDHIAFYSNREPKGVFVMEATGENLRPVIAGCHHPAWSPDAQEIVCSKFGQSLPSTRNVNTSSVWVANVATGQKRLLTDCDAMWPTWSPSGARIAFWFQPPGAGRSDIATISRDGGEVSVVSKDASTNWNPVWSPDGKFLYFVSDRGGNMGFWRVAIDEGTGRVLGEPEPVLTPSTYSRHLSFSRDGRRMIYVQTDQESNIRAFNFDPVRERVVGDSFWITRGDRQIVRPELSPDLKRFVMRVPRRTQDDIVIVDRDGTNWHDVTNDKFFDRYPRWSPDGKKIAFTSDRGGRYEIWTIDADGTNLRQISFDSPGNTSFPLWSPDGNRLLFQRNQQNVIVDLNKSWNEQTPQPLPTPEKVFVVWDWSPDGKKLLGTFSNGKVAYYSFETNRYEVVADAGAPMWLPDSTRYISSYRGKAFIGDISTKRVHEIFSLDESQIRSIAISRDAKMIYFSVYSSESDIWMLDLPK